MVGVLLGFCLLPLPSSPQVSSFCMLEACATNHTLLCVRTHSTPPTANSIISFDPSSFYKHRTQTMYLFLASSPLSAGVPSNTERESLATRCWYESCGRIGSDWKPNGLNWFNIQHTIPLWRIHSTYVRLVEKSSKGLSQFHYNALRDMKERGGCFAIWGTKAADRHIFEVIVGKIKLSPAWKSRLLIIGSQKHRKAKKKKIFFSAFRVFFWVTKVSSSILCVQKGRSSRLTL